MDFLYTFQHSALVFCRVSGVLGFTPGFSSHEIPLKIKVMLWIAFTYSLSFTIKPFFNSNSPFEFLYAACMEMIFGFFLGLCVRILFSALDLAGQLISFHLNLSNAVMFNPTFGGSSALVSTFLNITAVALFFETNQHHNLCKNIIKSYGWLSINKFFHNEDMMVTLLNLIKKSFEFGFKLSAPVLLIGIGTQIIAGIVNRLLPQIQIFFVSIPFQILIMLTVLLGTAWILLGNVKILFLELPF